MGKIHEALQKTAPTTATNEEEMGATSPRVEIKTTGGSSSPIPRTPASSQHSHTKKVKPTLFSEAPPFSAWNERLHLSIESSSTIAENFRKLRTVILHPDKGEPPRTILITSAVSEEGKGFTTANLGYAIAQGLGTSCLAMDCDLRRPTLAEIFGYRGQQQGISQYLNGDLTEWKKLILPTAHKKLSIFPSGPSPENPAELIDSPYMQDLLAEIVAEQDDRIVLLDSPPMVAAAESSILAKLVDKVVIVVRWNTSGREQVKNLIEAIGRDKIIGIVFNAFELNALDAVLQKKGYYGYYSYYGRGY